jgi:hypothetical protein
MSDIRLLTGALVTLVTLSVTAFQLLGENTEIVVPAQSEAPRLELRIVEKMPPMQQAAIPRKWVAPPSELAIEWLAFLDTVNDTKMDPAAPGAKTVRVPTLAAADIEADTEMESAPIDWDAGNRRALAVFSAERTGMEFAGPPAAAKVAVATRASKLEPDPQTTGSLGLPNSIKPRQPAQAPAAAPVQTRPPARQPVYRTAARAPEPVEPQRELPPSPLAFLFPGGGNSGAPDAQKYPPFDRTAIGVLQPCCRRGD